ncbi:hypothetical protein J2W35_006133 [Variovorax boronicumulans]|uniref:hypothetical protein n=1 Tax=Variovorax boronicumulans TaxID=436515 RepID=UPI0027815B0A|nr:hypothetical protein [Variovorax boronicumulans]MDQ0085753.1 hypothetical protein [Variovorax boronicumulans]
MVKTSRSSCVISTRLSSDTRTRFAALAARHQLSASDLLAKMVDEVLKTNGAISLGSDGQRSAVKDLGLRGEGIDFMGSNFEHLQFEDTILNSAV